MAETKKIKLLHLEANGVDVELVCRALEDQDYEVDSTPADDKTSFLSKLDTQEFDVILMDYEVPGFSAEEAIKCVQEKKINTPIIIFSGAIGYETAIQYIKLGAFDYVLRQNVVVLPQTIQRALTEQSTQTTEKNQSDINQVIKVTKTGVFRVDTNGRMLSINEPLCDMLGYSKSELGEEGWLQCVIPAEKESFLKEFHALLHQSAPFEIKVKLITKNLNEIWVRCNCIPENVGKKIEFIGAIVDITHLKKTEDELVNLSMHDALTGLPNRRYFADAVQNMVYEYERGHLNSFAVFYVDLDKFKTINDVLGHQSGDELLKQAAARFKASIRKSDIIARIGGDEFLLVFKHVNSIGEVAFLADNLLNKFRSPFYIGDHECLSTLSIGIVYVEETGTGVNAESIIQKADQALYRAKARGRNCYEIFTENISNEILHTAFIESALRHAIEKNELSLVFQPQINVLKSAIYGFEVLLRWKQSVYGDISPAVFIPIAEESGQINIIGSWVFDTTLNMYEHFIKEVAYLKNHSVTFSINISPKQLLVPGFIEAALKKIKEKKFDPSEIVFELTETSLIQNRDQLKIQFENGNSKDAYLAVDDFGTGYSSFTNLKELPIKIIKIDQTFVQAIENDINCRNIIKSIVSLARAMSITVIAEGVETREQLDFLYENGCYIMQGYYFSKPIFGNDLVNYVKNFVV